MEVEVYSHLDGERSIDLQVRNGLLSGIVELPFSFRLNSAAELREKISIILRGQGWSEDVRLAVESKISITAMHGSTALCLQTGNMGRFYADLLKLQYLFANGKATAAIYIIPTKRCAKEIGSNVANFERLVEELILFESIITIPILVIGLR